MRAGPDVVPEEALNWKHAAIAASNLSETELLVGEIGAATATAEKAVAFADRAGSASRSEGDPDSTC